MSERSNDLVLRLRHGDTATRAIWFRTGEVAKPISIGRQGEWRVDAEGVEDLHAYVQFDGRALWIIGLHPENPPLVDGMPLREEWTEVPSPSVLALGALRIVVDQADESEAATESLFRDGFYDLPGLESPPEELASSMQEDIPVVVDDRSVESEHGHRSRSGETRVLGSTIIRAAIEQAMATSQAAGETDPARAVQAVDPGSTRILDIKSLWPQAQLVAAGSSAPLSVPKKERPGRSLTPTSEDIAPGGAPKGLGARFRQASPQARAIILMLPITLALVINRTGVGRRLVASLGGNTRQPAAAPQDAPTAALTPVETKPASAALRPAGRAPSDAEASAGSVARKGSPGRTLEREAADAVARADYGSAVKLYEELAAAHPGRTAFSESARILRDKK
ncbi:MAG TPA: hypothetical protein VF881_02460 [Polyangiaceae bacterium]